MRYALLIYNDAATVRTLTAEQMQSLVGEWQAVARLPSVVNGFGLKDVDDATTVRVQDGQTLITDGPFAETKEILGGIFIVDAENLDGALELAAKLPSARMGAIEVRPVWVQQ